MSLTNQEFKELKKSIITEGLERYELAFWRPSLQQLKETYEDIIHCHPMFQDSQESLSIINHCDSEFEVLERYEQKQFGDWDVTKLQIAKECLLQDIINWHESRHATMYRED